jgi:hypothetical protein
MTGNPGHALVVGGSGMLAGLCRRLAAEAWQVTVVGRDGAKLARATAGDPRLTPLSVDYEDLTALAAALEAAVAARGPIVLAVCWIRSWAPQSLLAAAHTVAAGGRLFHVVGSQASGASAAAAGRLECRPDLRYRRVELGAVRTGAHERWLTHEEISDGVHEAIRSDRPYHLIGVRPRKPR